MILYHNMIAYDKNIAQSISLTKHQTLNSQTTPQTSSGGYGI